MTETVFDLRELPGLPSCIGPVRVSAHALRKYREEHIRVTHARHRLEDERMYQKVSAHLREGKMMIRKNALTQALKHGGHVAHYMVDDLWVMVISRDHYLLDIYRKDRMQDIVELYHAPLK